MQSLEDIVELVEDFEEEEGPMLMTRKILLALKL